VSLPPVEIVRRLYELFERSASIKAGFPEIERLLHREAEYVSPPDAIEPGTRRGLDGWRLALEHMLEGLGRDARFDLRSAEQHGEQVLAEVAIRTGGTASGVEVDGPTIGSLFSFEDGLIRRMEWFWTVDEARARLGG